MKWIDTHAHYDKTAFNEDRSEVFKRLSVAGIEKVVCPAISYGGISTMMDTLNQYPNVYYGLGQHPKYLLSREQRKLCLHQFPKYRDLQQYLVDSQYILNDIKIQIVTIKSLLNNDRVCAVGEVGLDYSYYPSPDEKALQSAVFQEYVEISLKTGLPLILHVRDAHEDVINILKSYKTRFTGVIHCFRGDKELADQYIDLGFSIGIGTSIFVSPQLRESVRYIDLNRIVLETDSPYLSVEEITDDRNTSLSLPLVAEEIGREKGISVEQVAETVYNNSIILFRL